MKSRVLQGLVDPMHFNEMVTSFIMVCPVRIYKMQLLSWLVLWQIE